MLPAAGPDERTVGIFAFLSSWNDFMMPQLIIADPTLQTLPVVQTLFQDAVQHQLQRSPSRPI